MAQPTWVDMQMVWRFSSGSRTVSIGASTTEGEQILLRTVGRDAAPHQLQGPHTVERLF